MAGKLLRDVDSAERAQLMRVSLYFGPACFVILTLMWSFLHLKGVIPGWLLGVLVVLNVPLTVAGVLLLHEGTNRASRGLVKVIFSAGDIPPPPSYPQQDVLIVRGRYAEAAEYFRDHIRINPEDIEARLRLADLLERHLNEFAHAERLYLEVRRLKPDPRQEMAAANGLIDLYRKAGRRDRLKVELARFAQRYRGTAQGEAAAREVRELKAEDLAAGS